MPRTVTIQLQPSLPNNFQSNSRHGRRLKFADFTYKYLSKGQLSTKTFVHEDFFNGTFVHREFCPRQKFDGSSHCFLSFYSQFKTVFSIKMATRWQQSERRLSFVFCQRSSSVKGRLLSKVVFRQRSSSVKGRLPSKVVFRQRSSSIKGCLLSKVVFH